MKEKIIIIFLCFFSLCGCIDNNDLSFEDSGKRAYANHEYQKAIQFWSHSFDKDPQKKHLFYKIGNAYLKLADIDSALKYFEKAEQFFPEDLHIKKDIIRILLIKGFYVQAQKKIEYLSASIKNDVGLCLLQGDIFLLGGQYKDAEKYYKEAIFLSKGLPRAYIKLAFCLRSGGNKSDAEKYILKIIEGTRHLEAEDAVLLSDYFFEDGEYEKAEKYILQAVKINKYDQGYKVLLCKMYLKTGQKVKALKALMAFSEKYPENIRFKLMLADRLMAIRDMDKAYNVLEEAKKLLGRDRYDYNMVFAKYWFLQGKTTHAIAFFKNACDERPELFSGYYMLGLAYFASGQKKLAEKCFVHALILIPDNIDCLLIIADLHYKNKEYDLSLGYLEQVLKIDPLNMRANRLKGLCYFEQKKIRKAFSAFCNAFYDRADLSTAYYLGRTFEALPESLGQRAKTLNYYSRILDERGFVPEIFFRYIFLLVEDKKQALAKKLLHGYFSKGSKNCVEKYVSGLLYMKLEDYDTARSIFESLYTSGKYSEDLFLQLSRIYEIKGERDKLKKILIKFAETYPYCKESWLKLADFYLRGGGEKEALASLKEGVIKNPRASEILANLAWLITENNDENIEQALDYARKAYELNPEEAFIADTLGWVYLKKEAYSQAQWMFKDAEKKAPEEGIVKYHLGFLAYKQGKLKQASLFFDQALNYKLSSEIINEINKMRLSFENFKVKGNNYDKLIKDQNKDFLVFPGELTDDSELLPPKWDDD